jgi:alkaline phosphatase
LGEDGLPYAMLGYANGPGYRNYTNGSRPDVSNDDFDNLDYRPPTPLPLESETHGGDDVRKYKNSFINQKN